MLSVHTRTEEAKKHDNNRSFGICVWGNHILTWRHRFRKAPVFKQPRSQALPSPPPLVVGRPWSQPVTWPPRIWVVKISLGQEGWQCFDCCCGKLCGFQNLEQSLKTTRFIGVWCGILPLKNVTLFLPSPKYRTLSFTKKFGSRMKLFDG